MNKLNRCVEHGQELVALCVDQLCQRRIKAVCPLQLYNDHHNHQFQNLQKIFNEWSFFQRQMNETNTNIDRNVIYSHMDQIIEQLIARTRQHLLQTRRDFETKINFYYDSKPVKKISIGMRGIQKIIKQRYLQVNKDQIDQAKFFTQVYGMKKLVSDTSEQRDKFTKEIILAYAKIKQQLFLDYPKFQAMVKAKQFEYCQIIKELRQSLADVQTKYKQVADRQGKVDEQLKQAIYQNTKNRNQLRNKQALLEQTSDKLRTVTKKYNQQAQQAIQKARSIMSKCTFEVTNLKNIYRINPRVVRVGDKQSSFPQFASAGVAEGKCWLKINRFDVGSWILVGVFYPGLQQRNEFEFDNYKDLGHGCYLMDNNRWCYSDHQQENNCRPAGFQFFTNDILRLEYFPLQSMLRVSKMVAGWQQFRLELKVKSRGEQRLFWCVAMKGTHTQVQIV